VLLYHKKFPVISPKTPSPIHHGQVSLLCISSAAMITPFGGQTVTGAPGTIAIHRPKAAASK